MKKILASLLSFFGIVNANADVNKVTTSNLDIPDWSKMSTEEIYQMRKKSKTLEGFGFKTSWYAISEDELKRKNLTIQDLANQLNLQQQEYLSWNEGFVWKSENYYNQNSCFIAPSLRGWLYIVCGMSDELNLLEGKIDNYYGFTSYRVVGAVAWRIVKNGITERYFSFANDLLHNQGNQTQAERQLGLVDLSGLNEDEAVDKIFEHYEKPDFVNITNEKIPAKINEILTEQNPLTFDEICIDEVKDKGIVGFLPN